MLVLVLFILWWDLRPHGAGLFSYYQIRPNYRSVHLGFSKILGKPVVKMYLNSEGSLKKREAKDLFDDN